MVLGQHGGLGGVPGEGLGAVQRGPAAAVQLPSGEDAGGRQQGGESLTAALHKVW